MTSNYLGTGTVTSADDAGVVNMLEMSNGKPAHIQGDFRFGIANGTTLDAVFQRKNAQSNWVTVYDVNSHTTLDGAKEFIVRGGGWFRISVTTATGTWDYELERV